MALITVDARFRLGLQRVLARLGDRESFSVVQADLGEADPEIRAGAIRLIGELGLREFLPNIQERLQKLYGRQHAPEELPFTIAVFNALKKIGTREISEELARRFEQLAGRLKPAAIHVIAAHGAGSAEIDGFFQGLIRLDTPYPHLRAQAVELYGTLAAGHPDKKALVATIRKCLKDESTEMARAAAETIAKLLGERLFELPEWGTLAPAIRAELILAAPAIPAARLEEAFKDPEADVRRAAVQRILSAVEPPQSIRDVIRMYSQDASEETVVTDRLMASLGGWNDSGHGRLVLIQSFLYMLKRQAGVLEKFLPTPGAMLGDMDKLIARLRRALLRTGTEQLSESLFLAMSGRGDSRSVFSEVEAQLKIYPKEGELKATVQELMAVQDDRIRKRIAAEVKSVPAGAFIPIKRILKIMPPLKESALVPTLRVIKDLARFHGDQELEWLAVVHLAGCRDGPSLAAVSDAVLGSDKAAGPRSPVSAARRQVDVALWIRSLSVDTANARVRETLLTLIRSSTHPDTFRAAVDAMTAKVDTEVSSILMLRLPSLKGAMRFIVIQSIGRMGDRVHLPVFLGDLKAAEEDRKLAGLLGLEKLLDRNPDLPPDTVTGPLYELKNHSSALVRASAIALLVRLKDPNRVELVSELIGSDRPIPVGSYRLVPELVREGLSDDGRQKLYQALLSRVGRLSEDEEAVCEAFRSVLDGRPFAELLNPRRQRAESVEDLRDLLRTRSAAQATTDFKISKAIQRRAIAFLDITGFTPRAAKMTAIELGFFLVQVEDEILPFVTGHQGLLVKRLGDGFLLSFPGSAEALSASLEMLMHLAKKNQLIQEDDRIRLRVGIHVGDVLVDRDDVFGDTVNVAARVEAQAKPMCICLTEDVFRDLPTRNESIESMGPVRLKGKDEPVTLYRVRLDVIYEAQTEALQKLMATPDWLPKIRRFELVLDEKYRIIKEKIEEARHMVAHGDYTHAESLVEEIEKMLL